ncbi:MAG: hypothetical protein CR959_01530 [Fusobacteriales bacterium]|nr:MAG: hypothetical protein CR959_01530 [Fusobacteriales bacterium]
MNEKIKKFIEKNNKILWIKSRKDELTKEMLKKEIENFYDESLIYSYSKEETINLTEMSKNEELNDLYTCIDTLYPLGIKKVPIFLIISASYEELKNEKNINYLKEIMETKIAMPNYKFSVIVIETEIIPEVMKEIVDIIEDEENEKYIAMIIEYINKFSENKGIKLETENINEILKNFDELIDRNINFIKNKNIGIEKDMVFVEGGEYKPKFADEEIEVIDLYVSKYQLVQEEWEKYMDENPSEFKGERKPVESIEWIQALEFCNKISKTYGFQPVYKIEDGKLSKIIYKDGEEIYPYSADFSKTEGYRLPIELEWEWFARGGVVALENKTFDTTYAGSNDIEEVAWHFGNSGKQTHTVGLKKANELGLYDCSGNVREWCYDIVKNYFGIPDSDFHISKDKPYIYDNEENTKVVRGGSRLWDDLESKLIRRFVSSDAYKDIGFRIVRTAHITE